MVWNLQRIINPLMYIPCRDAWARRVERAYNRIRSFCHLLAIPLTLHYSHLNSAKFSLHSTALRSPHNLPGRMLKSSCLSRTFSLRQFSLKNIFVHFVIKSCVFVSLRLPVSMLEIEHNTGELKRWTKNLKYCERNKRYEKWKRLVFLVWNWGLLDLLQDEWRERGRQYISKKEDLRIAFPNSMVNEFPWSAFKIYAGICWM